MRTDKERFDWLERNLFDKKWDGTIGEPPRWSVVGHWRHIVQVFRGDSLREALDQVMDKD